jgi:hypothetical protein
MSIVQTTLIFLGIPVVATLAIAALVYARAAERTPRYRPGGPWPFEPVWYLPHPEHSGPVSSLHSTGGHTTEGHTTEGHTTEGHTGGGHTGGAHSAGSRQAITGRVAEPAMASGGASGEW